MSSPRLCAAITALSLFAVACGTATPSAAQGRPVSPDVPWWQDRVYCEVFVRSFADSHGDGIAFRHAS
jgi:hypothetical protein